MIRLDEQTIERALPLIAVGLDRYCRLQEAFATANVSRDRAFQRAFNGFYRVRRNGKWQAAFYDLLQQSKADPQSFAETLRALHAATGKVEASFASKLTATVDPRRPVIDAFVLTNLRLRLPRAGPIEPRLARIIAMHDLMGEVFTEYLNTEAGRYLITRFGDVYPDRQLTPVKVLDLVLWQTRQPSDRSVSFQLTSR